MSERDIAEEQAREELVKKLLDGYRNAIRAKGIDEDRLAEELHRGLNATKPEIQKIKGIIENIDKGWNVVVESATAQVEDEKSGKALTLAKGDTIVMTELVDHGIRQKVRKDAEQTLGLTEKDGDVEHKGTIIVRTYVPEPDPLPDAFKEGSGDEDRFTDDSEPT